LCLSLSSRRRRLGQYEQRKIQHFVLRGDCQQPVESETGHQARDEEEWWTAQSGFELRKNKERRPRGHLRVRADGRQAVVHALHNQQTVELKFHAGSELAAGNFQQRAHDLERILHVSETESAEIECWLEFSERRSD